MLTQNQIDQLVNDKAVVKISLKMTEINYITSMISDLQNRIYKANPKLEIKWLSYTEFVHNVLHSGFEVEPGQDFNFTNKYCKYIDKCAEKIYILEEFYKLNDVLDLTRAHLN